MLFRFKILNIFICVCLMLSAIGISADTVEIGHSSLKSLEKTKTKINPADQRKPEDSTFEPGILPGLAALFPGVILHGSGHFAAGDTESALDLLALEGAGFLALAASLYYLSVTGASGRTIAPIMPVVTSGMSLFVYSWFADIYGSFAGNRMLSDAAPTDIIHDDSGYGFVYDPQFAYRNFATLKMEFKHRAFYASPQLWLALDDANSRVALELSYQLIGRYGPFGKTQKNWFNLHFVNRFGWHRYGTERFEKKWLDAAVAGRIKPGSIWKSLTGSFVSYEFGYNAEWVTFLIDADIPVLYSSQFLFRSGFGFFLGNMGELEIYYNHRKDYFAGGLGSGFMGFVGIDLKVHVFKAIYTELVLQTGSASVINAKLGFAF